MSVHVVGVELLKKAAGDLVKKLSPIVRGATVITLSGDLGAGKTTFAQGVAEALGVAETVTSPTFVLEKRYQLNGQAFAQLIHIDAYRLKSVEELAHLEWNEIISDSKNLILIEWPERIKEAVPENAIRITVEGSGDSRELSIDDTIYGKKEQ